SAWLPALLGVFFPLLLNLRFALGMARVGRHLSPAMACQQAIDHRGLDRLAETLRQSGPNRGNDHQMAGGSAFQPRFQERNFFLLGEEGFPASAPVAGRVGQRRLQHRLTLSQGFDRGGDGSGQLRPLNNEWINPAWSCHADTLPLFDSSWKRIRIRTAAVAKCALAGLESAATHQSEP